MSRLAENDPLEIDGPREPEDPVEEERYELAEGLPYSFETAASFEIGRREFVAVLGAGLLLSAGVPAALGQERPERRGRGGRGGGSGSIAERVHIGADGTITVLTGKVEVGQGARTQLGMAAAEELRVPLGAVRLIMADSSLCPDDGGTSGSRTTPSTVPAVRRACAAARELLLGTAAAEWKVERAALSVRDGKIVGPGPEQVASYGDLVAKSFEKGLEGEIEPGVAVTVVGEWKVLGTSTLRLGGEAIVTGAHRYPSDIRLPGLLHGKVLRPPSFGAKLVSIDLAAAKAMDGVTAVRDGDFVGFAAPTSARAREALEAVLPTARWEETPQPASDDLYEHLVARAGSGGDGGRRGGGGGGRRGGGGERGSVETALAGAAKALRERYHVAYIQHAPLEPRAAAAEWKDGALSVWTGTQNPDRVRGQLGEAFRVPSDKVRVVVPDTGGGFGGKHTGEVAIEAARLAREAGKPVSLTWTREEEFTWAYFRPAGVIEVAGGLDAGGRLIAWEQTSYNSGGSAVETPYAVPNARARSRSSDSPLRQGSYRALASTANVFARESFMDELAAAAGVEPLAFRLRELEDARLRAVLESAAERFAWERRRKALEGRKDRGVGLACGTEKGSYTAACVEIEVAADSGRFRVVEVCQAFECGAIHNPDNVRAQVEGSIIQGLGAALREEIRFRDGKILNPSFSSYRVPRFRDVPRIEVVLLDRRDLPSAGAGETPIIAVAPAIGNALFAAAGARLRSLPLRSERYRSV